MATPQHQNYLPGRAVQQFYGAPQFRHWGGQQANGYYERMQRQTNLSSSP
jgi:hypothetical protein